ncbi:NAD(P)-dependent dehydrogenase (short-subunit alcohol dehydrogenase family) [Salinibacter ruber]|uniref:Peroxisomal trans-2-enoyl-CoA reductase n=1 Tax=Salinibacter ruber TaxID=146919 RepID=A0AAW5P9P3_9BACT|nr:SDR family oxidoreductase [Salinibacter ruber]MCS3631088.1 NAD(P)-dependent dehydrogenase (short-subunit alcohol dehydrogenase family) [Salinibacter ruber]MCS3636837.1 NAD(P)-dependent dehydrogenase (short-subunit alcohol dehydrogenase family) [Salinibacter ruber]MCS3642060.1 NAD(P)-dependent dehydrogenase (short-subunit alcohol dehydrogenase family) [Salinibacter ruber]MCS3664639.1 NAD(P)-dependent dehydrogenase (short-subunit alcohol dehydrogenase family) [Salinibacter ruber]MCS3671497.1 
MSDSFAPDLLADQHIVVTGGGTGLGRAMALRFADLGAAVTINGRRPDPLAETVRDIEEAGGAAEGIQCNVRDYEAVQAFFEEAEDRQGPVTRLVNNAAANFLAPTEDISPNGFDAIVQTNLYGSFYCTQACGQRWLERDAEGVVLSIATTYAETGSAYVVPSAMSKAGIVAMTRSLAAEWGSEGIRLNAVAPGPFPTEGAWDRLVPDDDLEQKMRERVPVRRFGEPEELATLAGFLLSDLSAFMNGEVVTFDGGEALAAGGQFNTFTRMPRRQVKALMEQMRPE